MQHRNPLHIFLSAVLCLLSSLSFATHMIAVEIRARPVDCKSRQYEIILIGYVNTESTVAFGGEQDILSFGDGTSIQVPELASAVIDPVLKIGRVEYKVTHTYNTNGSFLLSYREYARNEGIINMDGPEFTNFYSETRITISEAHCDSSPHLTVPPVDRACIGTAYYHNPGAIDLDDDSISFSFTTPKKEAGQEVTNYRSPNHAEFYTTAGINYNQANENGNGPPTFRIDPVDGTVTWDSPGAPGEYALAIKVTGWRFNTTDSTWVESGFSIRDMQVVVEDCSNRKPDLVIPDDFCVTAGTTVQFTVPASDPDGDPVVVEAFSDMFTLNDNPATVFPADASVQATAPPNDTASIRFIWNTACSHVKNQPYKIVFKITDRPQAGPRLVRFKTVSIKVIAPAPEYENINVNPITKKVTLSWKDYPCENVESIQVWRRVAEYNYDQPACNTGMPYFLRYNLVASLPGDAKTYVDADLAIGAQYCYRIVALIGSNKVPSKISLDTCIIPKPAKAPVITNVSIVETSDVNGSIQLRWTSPFEIDKIQYPPPYAYKIYRSTGFGNSPFEQVTEKPVADTVYIDGELNTQAFPYAYKIELFVPELTAAPLDTSSLASSVFLTVTPERGQIKLAWEANTPWFNFIQSYPYHLVYRSEQGPAGSFILIDSVDVNEKGLQYIDDGKFQNRQLQEDLVYYYKILTRGAYGNPAIVEPLENFSQIAGGSVLDSRPPCIPSVAIERTDCSTLDCTTDTYYNKISWTYPENTCLENGLTFQIFIAEKDGDEFLPLATTSDNSFEHKNLTSLAKCYTVAAIDRAGNMSGQSDPVCNDNCPYFELPNIFTPGAEDGLNDRFVSFGAADGTSRCARFVKEVDLKIYNRWGAEIYSINDVTPAGSTLLWDGTSSTGKQMESGVYFYSANVSFDVRDPREQNKTIKGWVHLVRNNGR